MYRTLKLLKRSLIILISILIVFLINGGVEFFIVQNKIENFKERAEFVGQDQFRYNTFYYRVPVKYDYEDTSRNIFNQDPNKRWVGSTGDIILTNRNPMRAAESKTLALSVGFLAQNFFVGHATLNINDSGSRLIEVLGNSSDPEDNVVIETYNNWITIEEALRDEGESPIIIGLRIKNTTEEQRTRMVDYAKSQIGRPYNYSFLFNRSNTYYCTDLVSRSIKSAGININYDYLATTGNDMIVSKNVYIIFIREQIIVDGEIRFNYYYLE